jgi:hypothetical protein
MMDSDRIALGALEVCVNTYRGENSGAYPTDAALVSAVEQMLSANYTSGSMDGPTYVNVFYTILLAGLAATGVTV